MAEPLPSPVPPVPPTPPDPTLVDAVKIAMKETREAIVADIALFNAAKATGWDWKHIVLAVVAALGLLTGGGTVTYMAARAEPISDSAKLDAILTKLDVVVTKLDKPAPQPPTPPDDPVKPTKLIDITVAQGASPNVWKFTVATKLKEIYWVPPDGGDWHTDGKLSAIFVAPLSETFQSYLVEVLGVQDGKPVYSRVVVNQGPRPPPTPKPDPTPPTPTDPYFPLDGKTRVLMVYDSNAMDKLSAGQLAAIEGTAVRKWLDDHCAPDGYRLWPSTVKGVENAPALWQKAFSKALASKTALPFIVVSNGKGVEFIQGLPADDVLPLLKKAGGE